MSAAGWAATADLTVHLMAALAIVVLMTELVRLSSRRPR